jgi:hypothetical protein
MYMWAAPRSVSYHNFPRLSLRSREALALGEKMPPGISTRTRPWRISDCIGIILSRNPGCGQKPLLLIRGVEPICPSPIIYKSSNFIEHGHSVMSGQKW